MAQMLRRMAVQKEAVCSLCKGGGAWVAMYGSQPTTTVQLKPATYNLRTLEPATYNQQNPRTINFLVCRYARSLGLAARQFTPAIDGAF